MAESPSLKLLPGPFGLAIPTLNCSGAIQPTDGTKITDNTKFSGLHSQCGQPRTRDEPSSSAPIGQPCLQIIGKKSFKCIYNNCGTRFTRISDLKRHHQAVHQCRVSFYCRFDGCRRAARGFVREDKRDDHEKRLHVDTKAVQEGEGSTVD
jgi:hypothetical protein